MHPETRDTPDCAVRTVCGAGTRADKIQQIYSHQFSRDKSLIVHCRETRARSRKESVKIGAAIRDGFFVC